MLSLRASAGDAPPLADAPSRRDAPCATPFGGAISLRGSADAGSLGDALRDATSRGDPAFGAAALGDATGDTSRRSAARGGGSSRSGAGVCNSGELPLLAAVRPRVGRLRLISCASAIRTLLTRSAAVSSWLESSAPCAALVSGLVRMRSLCVSRICKDGSDPEAPAAVCALEHHTSASAAWSLAKLRARALWSGNAASSGAASTTISCVLVSLSCPRRRGTSARSASLATRNTRRSGASACARCVGHVMRPTKQTKTCQRSLLTGSSEVACHGRVVVDEQALQDAQLHHKQRTENLAVRSKL
jgi:hypothetical protein